LSKNRISIISKWLQLIRWPNLLMVALAQVLFKYAFLPAFEVSSKLNTLDFILLCASIILVTAAGNIINDIYDINTDFVNGRSRPLAQQHICISKAYTLYFLMNISAVALISFLSSKFKHISLIIIVTTVILLLFFYAKRLKSIVILGNVLISVLVSLSFLLVIYVEIFILSEHKISIEIQNWIIGYAVFAFWANLNREWIKDVQDIKGDYAQNVSTLPILIGKARMNKLIFMSTLLLIFSLIAGVKVYFQPDLIFILYLTFGTCVPLVYVLFHMHRKELNTNYKMLSHIYKLVMLIGVMSLILFKI